MGSLTTKSQRNSVSLAWRITEQGRIHEDVPAGHTFDDWDAS